MHDTERGLAMGELIQCQAIGTAVVTQPSEQDLRHAVWRRGDRRCGRNGGRRKSVGMGCENASRRMHGLVHAGQPWRPAQGQQQAGNQPLPPRRSVHGQWVSPARRPHHSRAPL